MHHFSSCTNMSVDTTLTLTYGQSDKLIPVQAPVDELTTSGGQVKPISEGYSCVRTGGRCIDTVGWED